MTLLRDDRETTTGPTATLEETGRVGAPHRLAKIGLLRDLERPGDMFANLGPNWYASIMGTGIVAVAAAVIIAFWIVNTLFSLLWFIVKLVLVAIVAVIVYGVIRAFIAKSRNDAGR